MFRLVYVFLLLFPALSFSQSVITGTITDKETGKPLVGANILLEDLVTGTTTDDNGFFNLILDDSPPIILEISMDGYETRTVRVITPDQKVDVGLLIKLVTGMEIVITASKIEESLLRAPVSIEKMEAEELRALPSPDAYSGLANLKGVQMNTGSITFNSVNTRGFGDMQNWRFVQLIDGVDMNAPGANYAVGALSAPIDLDLQSIELVPGASSALYGPNAFNGILNLNTKNPFVHQGLSAEIKGGVTVQNAAGVNPFGEVSLRYGKAFGNKFAFKIAGSVMMAHDWEANDESFRITPALAAGGNTSQYNSLPSSTPFFDAVNRYGDEARVFINLGDTAQFVHRTGIAERDLVNYQQQVYKANLHLVYRPFKGVDLRYDGRFVQGDAVLRHTTIYPMVNTWQQVHNLELKSSHYFLRGYYSMANAADSYFLLGTGAFIQRGLKSDSAWAADYAAAYRGQVGGVAGRDHAAARGYADRNIPGADSEAFQNLLRSSLDNPNVRSGGSKFVDRSSFIHVDGNYDFSKHWQVIQINAGGSFRRYRLDSEGNLFNDGELGFNRTIPIIEWGAYVQASKSFWDERLSLRASARYDKNQNYAGRITPRASLVFSPDKGKQHNLRFSYQTGFRNPANQETYIALDIADAILLGGVMDNINNYNYRLSANNPFTGASAGTIVPGSRIYDNFKTITSLMAVLQTGDPSRFVNQDLKPLVQEHLSTYEFGYKSLIKNRLFIDLAAYYNTYNNFVTRVNVFSPDANRVFSVYTNIEEQVVGYGANLGLEYNLFKDWKLSGNYSFADFDADSAVAKNPGFLPAFNTPKHRFNLALGSRRAWKNLGFNLRYRWTQGYTWQSPFGQGDLPSFQTLDLAIFYQLPKLPLALKLGGTNLLRQEYRTLYGGPMVGSQFYLSVQYDPVAYKVKQPSAEFSSSQEMPNEQPKKQKNKKSKTDKEDDDDDDDKDDEDEDEKPKKSSSKPKSNKKKGDNQPSKSLDRFW